MATVSTKITGIYRNVQLVTSLNLDLDFIQLYLDVAKNQPQLLEIHYPEKEKVINQQKTSKSKQGQGEAENTTGKEEVEIEIQTDKI